MKHYWSRAVYYDGRPTTRRDLAVALRLAQVEPGLARLILSSASPLPPSAVAAFEADNQPRDNHGRWTVGGLVGALTQGVGRLFESHEAKQRRERNEAESHLGSVADALSKSLGDDMVATRNAVAVLNGASPQEKVALSAALKATPSPGNKPADFGELAHDWVQRRKSQEESRRPAAVAALRSLAAGLGERREDALDMIDRNPHRVTEWAARLSGSSLGLSTLGSLAQRWAQRPQFSGVIDPYAPVGARIAQATHLEALHQSVLGVLSRNRDAIEASGRRKRELETKLGDIKRQPGWQDDSTRAQEFADLTAQHLAVTEESRRLRLHSDDGTAIREKLLAHIKEHHAWEPDTTSLPESFQKIFQEGLDFAGRLAAKLPGLEPDNLKLSVKTTAQTAQERGRKDPNRDHYRDGTISLSSKTNRYVAAHEIGHLLTERLPGVNEACQEFLEHRCGSERVQRLSELNGIPSIADWEMGRKDDFGKAFGEDAAYVGKDCGKSNTEVLSMGLEKLYYDPAHLARADPEFFKFMLGVLDGSLRSPPAARNWEI